MQKVAKAKFAEIETYLYEKNAALQEETDFIDYSKLDPMVIGIVGGDGIGPFITAEARRVLETLLEDRLKAGKVVFQEISGLTLENRLKTGATIPPETLTQLKACHLILKGPTTTPDAGGDSLNLESANVTMRRELDLFANVRPVRIPAEGVDWTFFRENTEGAYALGSKGFNLNEDIALDFSVTTTKGTQRIAQAAFTFARANGKTRVTAVTKANIIKTTDGKFLNICRTIAKDYPEISFDDWYVDIMAAKLIDKKRRGDFQVFILPNLYGDILTDLAAQIQGGVGTAGSANIGKQYAMFEAIHGSAPRMVEEGRLPYADPSSMIRAGAMLLVHAGFTEEAKKLDTALDFCLVKEKKVVVTGWESGDRGEELTDYIIRTLV